jgi:hypothetical protein
MTSNTISLQPEALQAVLDDLASIHKAVFGDIGDRPDVYADYDRCLDLERRMSRALKTLGLSASKQSEADVVAWAVTSKSGMHIGLWDDEAVARSAAAEQASAEHQKWLRERVASPPPAQPAVTVKALEWESIDSTSMWASTKPLWMTYRITLRADRMKALRLEMLGNRTEELGIYGEWDEAKAAAQADYSARILSAIDGSFDRAAGDIRATIHKVLCDFRLPNMVCEDEDAPYPLVDAVTAPGRSIDNGKQALFDLADEIAFALTDTPRPSK